MAVENGEEFEFKGSILDSFKMNTSTEDSQEEEVTDVDEEDEEEEEEEETQEDSSEETFEDTSEDEEYEEESDLDGEDEDVTFTPLASFLAERGSLTPVDDKEYEDSVEGLSEMIEDTVESRRQEWLNSLDPEAVKVLNFINSGGAIKDYVEFERSNSYSDVDMDEPDNWRLLVEEHMRITGMDDEDIEDYIRDLEDTGMIEKHAAKAQKYLEKRHNELQQEMISRQEQERIQAEEEYQREQKEFVDTILNGKVGDFEIPKPERKKFLDYLTEPITSDGKTQYQMDDNYEDRIKLAYFKFKKFDFSDIEKKAKTKAVIEIKKGMSRFTDSMAKSSTNMHNEDAPERNQSKTKLPNLPWMGGRFTE